MGARLLFVSGSIGLGHVTRDREIARALRSTVSDLEIRWLAAGNAAEVLKEWGEDVLPESAAFHDGTDISDAAASGFSLNLVEYFLKVRRSWSGNARVFSDALATHDFDIVVADEAYELGTALANDPDMLGVPFVMIYDFMGFGPTGRNPLDAWGCWWINRLWSGVNRRLADRSDVSILFAGEEEDVPDDALAPLLPSRREHARKHFRFLGHILTFDPLEYRDRAAIRKELGWAAREEVIVVTAGGTAAGRRLLELSLEAFSLVKERRPSARLFMVAGPRIAPSELEDRGTVAGTEGWEIHGFVPNLVRHLAACDLAVTHAGGTTTTELAALQKPFLYFPLEGHYEQQVCVAGRLERWGAGKRLPFRRTSAHDLAAAMLEELGREPRYPPIPVDGAARAAEKIAALLPPR